MNRKIIPAALASLLALSACVAPSQGLLDQHRADCRAGKQFSCNILPGLEIQVAHEKQVQAANVANGIALGLAAVAAGAAAGYSASHPVYARPVVIVCRPWWAC